MNWLDHIILILSCTAEIYICYDFFSAFFEKRNNINRYNCVLFMLFVAFMYFTNLFGSATLNLIITPIILLFYLYLVYSVRLLHGLICFIITISALVGSEFLFVIIAEVTNDNSGLMLSSMPYLTFTVKLLSFIILQIIKFIFGNNKNKITTNFFWLYISIPILSLGMMFVTYAIAQDVIFHINIKIALSFSFAFMLFANIGVFIAFNKHAEELHKSIQQDWIIEKDKMNQQYYKKIADMNEKRQELIHNFKQYTGTLNAMLQVNENNEAAEILKELNMELAANELRLYSNISFLDIILSEKCDLAKESNISFNVCVEPGVSFEGVKKTDYLSMIGNLLDNAIQGAARCNYEPFVKVNIFMENGGNFLVTKISNSYNKNYLLTHHGEYITTKKEKGVHGIGIKSVKTTAAKNEGIFSTEVSDEEFTVILLLPIKNATHYSR